MNKNKNDGEKVSKVRTESAFDPVEAALKQLYDQVASESIPDDFMALLDRLDGQSGPATRK